MSIHIPLAGRWCLLEFSLHFQQVRELNEAIIKILIIKCYMLQFQITWNKWRSNTPTESAQTQIKFVANTANRNITLPGTEWVQWPRQSQQFSSKRLYWSPGTTRTDTCNGSAALISQIRGQCVGEWSPWKWEEETGENGRFEDTHRDQNSVQIRSGSGKSWLGCGDWKAFGTCGKIISSGFLKSLELNSLQFLFRNTIAVSTQMKFIFRGRHRSSLELHQPI